MEFLQVVYLIVSILAIAGGLLLFRRQRRQTLALQEQLQHQVLDAQQALQKEGGRLQRLLSDLQSLALQGVSPTGRIFRQETGDGLVQAIATLIACDQVILLQRDPHTLELKGWAARGVAPEVLSQLCIREGEGILGKAAERGLPLQLADGAALPAEALPQEQFLKIPFSVWPIKSRARVSGLLVIDRALSAATDQGVAAELAQLLALQGGILIDNFNLYENLQALYGEMVEALAKTLQAKDPMTHRHSYRARALVRAVALELRLPEQIILQIQYGALLHDIGKVGIPDAILLKPSQLTDAEYDVMKNHCQIGFQILQPIDFLKPVAAMVLFHQEWFNGQGYPRGLAGEEIPLGARLVAIIDAWDAMTSNRPYRVAMNKNAAITELRRCTGTQFDPFLVDIFLQVIERMEHEGLPTTEEQDEVTAAVPEPQPSLPPTGEK